GANRINWGILPLEFAEPSDYGAIAAGHRLAIRGIPAGLAAGALAVEDETAGRRIPVRCLMTRREREILLAGGRLRHTRGGTSSAAIPRAPSRPASFAGGAAPPSS